MGNCKVKCSLCCVLQGWWWGLNWGLRPGRAGGLWGLRVCRFVELSRGLAAIGNHSAQSPASVSVANSGHAMGHYKGKYSLCSVQQVWWSLHWVLWPGWAGGLWGVRFC